MRFLFYFIACCTISSSINGQAIHGRTMNADNATPLSGVIIENLNNSFYNTVSDDGGYYSITAKNGDSIRFTLLGFRSGTVVLNGENQGWFSWIEMHPQSNLIDTVVIRKQLTVYQKDSIERREIYGKKVDYRPAKPRLPKLKELEAGKPFVIKAPISGFIEKRQKKYKRLKAFQQRYVATEAQNFIDSRYTPELVAELTHLTGDSLVAFIQAYSMPYSFARAASDLEVKMWVRYNYKEWIAKPALIPAAISVPAFITDTLEKP